MTQRGWVEFEHVSIGGIQIVTASRRELAEAMVQDCISKRKNRLQPARLVYDANGHALSLRETDNSYRHALGRADVIHADGGFLVTLSKLRHKRAIFERSATTDLIHDCAAHAERAGLSFFLLGGSEEINAECAKILQNKYPRLVLAGRRNGYFTAAEEPGVIQEINASAADVLWVGLGKPKEQIFASNWVEQLRASWVVTCGGCYHYITGDYPRAPAWMQKLNLEWLHRVATNPAHLLRRYAVTIPHALWLAISR
ncbi:WecB/TagA/CpsF family glycosyltransferase [Ramlibacter alkalitolerans]|uniref:WecB/TagA/CpsF family glycosyltransferase n=1 Tax=Ramlibacter alkalitolerans TaxID=2039631 RepID=A0ABS1JWM2_9BURK|nr:WecB/TagA/CpsF family glycosyltransferase [Ramlibacter alkalitolerans]MBL0428679.1 WecB/TagA/CpsF family glycosyltransferase [Ramlibacter alkalitolerans]